MDITIIIINEININSNLEVLVKRKIRGIVPITDERKIFLKLV